MNSIIIDTAPAALAGLLAKGFLHSHQDGKWRYSPYGGETVHVNDPTEAFEHRAEFANGRAAAVCLDPGLVVTVYKDGTRSLKLWDAKGFQRYCAVYSPDDPGEADQRAWIAKLFGVEV